MPTNYPLWEAPEDIPLEERRDFAVCRLLTEKARAAAADARAAVGRRALAPPLPLIARALGRSLAQAGVTALPASAFYSEGHRHITDSLARFCFCKVRRARASMSFDALSKARSLWSDPFGPQTDSTLESAFKRIIHSGLSKSPV